MYACEGFCAALVPPSPKDQDQLTMDPLPGTERSVNWTASGATPSVGVPAKSAVGGAQTAT